MTTPTESVSELGLIESGAVAARIVDKGEGLPTKGDFLDDGMTGKLFVVRHIFEPETVRSLTGRRWARAYVSEVEWSDTDYIDGSECFPAQVFIIAKE